MLEAAGASVEMESFPETDGRPPMSNLLSRLTKDERGRLLEELN